MIFVHDRGRMCNNLLQFAHVYAWAREHGRHAVSMRFAYKYPYFHIGHTRGHNFLMYLIGKYGAKSGLLPVVRFDEPDADYSANIDFMLSHRNYVVEGWNVRFYDLFLKYKADILSLFAFDEKVESSIAPTLGDAAQGDVKMGLHVRRGDYATWNGGRFLYSDGQYIDVARKAMALYPGRQTHLFVCGNDPSLNRRAYTDAFGEANVSFPDGNPGQDLCLLSHADCLIGAPSTFTLVASMYQDTPLYWIEDPSAPVSQDSFSTFDHLFRHIR